MRPKSRNPNRSPRRLWLRRRHRDAVGRGRSRSPTRWLPTPAPFSPSPPCLDPTLTPTSRIDWYAYKPEEIGSQADAMKTRIRRVFFFVVCVCKSSTRTWKKKPRACPVSVCLSLLPSLRSLLLGDWGDVSFRRLVRFSFIPSLCRPDWFEMRRIVQVGLNLFQLSVAQFCAKNGNWTAIPPHESKLIRIEPGWEDALIILVARLLSSQFFYPCFASRFLSGRGRNHDLRFFSLPLFRQKPIPEQVVKGVLGNNLFTETKKGKEYP